MTDYKRLISDGWKVVYRNKQMYVFKGRNRWYIVWNRNLSFKSVDGNHHSHLYNLNYSKKICDRIADEKIPHGAGGYIRNSYLRCSGGEYHERLVEYFGRKKELQRGKRLYKRKRS